MSQIPEMQAQLEEFHRRATWPEKATPPAVQAPRADVPLADAELLQRMFRSSKGPEIQDLFNGGTSRYGNDHSSADLALCNHLAWWTNRDPDRIDSLFRESGLYRSKWDRKDYREWTISKAIAACPDGYSPAPEVTYITQEPSTDERIAALEARLAKAEAEIRKQAHIIETQRLQLQDMEREAEAARNSKLKQAAPALVETARYVDQRRSSGKADERGFVRIYSPDIAQKAGGISDDSVARYLDVGNRAGLHTLERRRELKEIADPDTGEIKTVPVKSLWVKFDCTYEEQLERIARYNPAPEDRARVVNKPTCRKHPDAKAIRFVTYKCGECGDVLKHGQEDEPDDDPPPSPQVAVVNPIERGLGTSPQLAVREPDDDLPPCSSQMGECLQPGYCAKLGRCRWGPS